MCDGSIGFSDALYLLARGWCHLHLLSLTQPGGDANWSDGRVQMPIGNLSRMCQAYTCVVAGLASLGDGHVFVLPWLAGIYILQGTDRDSFFSEGG